MKRIVCALTALTLAVCLCAPALADAIVYTTASVNLREGPGLGYPKITALQAGTGLESLGRVSTDDRGVDWYQVRYYGEAVWISSRYSYLDPEAVVDSYDDDEEEYLDFNQQVTDIPLATPQAEITMVPSFDDEATLAPTFGVPGMIELSTYYKTSLKGSAIALGLKDYKLDETSEVRNMYYNDVLLIAGEENVEHFRVTGTGYTIFGVYVGMDVGSAQGVLTAAGLVQTAGTMGLYFEHPSKDVSNPDLDGFDSGVSVITDASGHVTEISWSSYTS